MHIRPQKACGLHCLKLKSFGVYVGRRQLLHNVNIHCHCGELTVVIGRNGAGKSTLLKAILGELPHVGSIEYRNREDGLIRPALKVGYVPQTLGLDDGTPTSVYDLFASLISRRPVFLLRSKKLRQIVEEQLKLFQAEHLIDRRMGCLSGGEQQRVMLALATYPQPDLLLLDEPVSGMDENGLQLFYSIVSELKHKFDMAIILVSHDLNYVSRYADQVVLIDGTVKASGRPEEVFISKPFRETFGNFRFDFGKGAK